MSRRLSRTMVKPVEINFPLEGGKEVTLLVWLTASSDAVMVKYMRREPRIEYFWHSQGTNEECEFELYPENEQALHSFDYGNLCLPSGGCTAHQLKTALIRGGLKFRIKK